MNRFKSYLLIQKSVFVILSVIGGSFVANNNDFVGVGPFSEPETRGLSRYIESISSNLVGALSFKSFGQKLLIPLAHTSAIDGTTLYNYNQMVSVLYKKCSEQRRSSLVGQSVRKYASCRLYL